MVERGATVLQTTVAILSGWVIEGFGTAIECPFAVVCTVGNTTNKAVDSRKTRLVSLESVPSTNGEPSLSLRRHQPGNPVSASKGIKQVS